MDIVRVHRDGSPKATALMQKAGGGEARPWSWSVCPRKEACWFAIRSHMLFSSIRGQTQELSIFGLWFPVSVGDGVKAIQADH